MRVDEETLADYAEQVASSLDWAAGEEDNQGNIARRAMRAVLHGLDGLEGESDYHIKTVVGQELAEYPSFIADTVKLAMLSSKRIAVALDSGRGGADAVAYSLKLLREITEMYRGSLGPNNGVTAASSSIASPSDSEISSSVEVDEKEDNLNRVAVLLPVLQEVAAFTRKFSKYLDSHHRVSGSSEESDADDGNGSMGGGGGGSHYHRYQQRVLDALREEFIRIRRDTRYDKALMPGLFVVLVEIMQICTAMEQPAALEPILRNVDERYLDICPNSIRVKTQYFWARHRLFQSRLPDAEHRLDDALKYCPDGHINAKQRILNLLIPCKVRKGILPSRELLERNQLAARWAPLLKAIRQGNLAEYERCRTEALSFDDEAGTGRQILPFFLDGMLVWCVYRNLLERTMTIYGSNQVPVAVVTAALRVSENDEDGHVCDTYAEGIVGRLLLYGYCKGYISYELKTLVLATRNAFPKPPWEQLREL
ncbi:hypothetical protein FOZ61_003523 [Perkinsus olseni]|uniref:Uncharacterized protein n=1 Tax=Perkinsus olseni TaxID=32597 RepID=A0A7J6LPR3_PEROL|nr:hypothetical protein FOZ61_003523 [Perkinsus olseni]